MKHLVLFVFFVLTTSAVFAQENPSVDVQSVQRDKTTALNVGFLMGGGSLIGLDFEVMPVKRLGIQAGVGIGSFGVGLNYHFQDRINSSFLSLVYWKQGFGDRHYASYVGPLFSLRLSKILQAGIGYGVVVSKGPAIENTKYSNMSSALLFNIGVYFPL